MRSVKGLWESPKHLHCPRLDSELSMGLQVQEVMSWKILHSGDTIDLSSLHFGSSATDMSTHWALS